MAVIGFAVGLCAALGGCASPTLPVPPPEPLALQEPLAALVPGGKAIQFEGKDALREAIVSLWNDDLQLGTIVKADDSGSYRGLLAVDVSCARPQNHIDLWQTDTDGKMSEVKTYRLPNTFGDVPLPPDDAGCPDAALADEAAAASDDAHAAD